jgi:hypothetical protein
MTLIFLPAMYAIWFRIRPENTYNRRRCTFRGNFTLPDLARHGQARPGQRQAGKDTGTA